MAEIASAYVSLLPSARGFGSKLNSQVGPAVTTAGKRGGLTFGKLFLAGAAVAIGRKAFDFIGDSLGEATEAAVATARTENVIKKMGNAAGISAKQVGDLAMAISNKTGIDDEAIQAGQNLLLTFGNIRNEAGKGNDIFNQTSALMVDLSAAMGTDAKGSAIQLGKALNDPIKGISALTRVGVSFTEQQKKQIEGFVESGKTMQAQKVILGELERQFGGAGAAMATPADRAKVAFGNLKEQIGTALLPTVNKLFTYFVDVGLPAMTRFADFVKTTYGPLAQTLVNFFRKGTESGDGFRTAVSTYIAIMRKWAEYITGTVVPAFQAKLVPAIAKIRAAMTVLGAKIQANKPELQQLLDAFKRFANFIITQVAPKLVTLYGKHLSEVIRVIGNLIDVIGGGVRAFNNIKDAITTAVTEMGAFKTAVTDKVSSAVKTIKGFPDKVTAAFTNAGTLLYDAGVSIIQGLIDGIGSKAGALKDKLGEYTSMIPKLKGPPKKDATMLVPAGKLIIDGLIAGLEYGKPKLEKSLKGLTEKIRTSLDGLKSTLSGFKSDFDSLAASVAGAFNPDMFGAVGKVADELNPATTALQEFMAGLSGNNSNLTGMLAALDQLKAAGASKEFLSGLFQSGNFALASELATSGTGAVKQASDLFDQNAALAATLGSNVAQNALGENIDKVASEIRELRKELKNAPKENGKETAKALKDAKFEVVGGNPGQAAYLRTGSR